MQKKKGYEKMFKTKKLKKELEILKLKCENLELTLTRYRNLKEKLVKNKQNLKDALEKNKQELKDALEKNISLEKEKKILISSKGGLKRSNNSLKTINSKIKTENITYKRKIKELESTRYKVRKISPGRMPNKQPINYVSSRVTSAIVTKQKKEGK